MYLQLDFPDSGPAIDSLLTTDFGLFVNARRITIDLIELFISVEQVCQQLNTLPVAPLHVSVGTPTMKYSDFNADDHAGAVLCCDDMFRVSQPDAEYQVEGVPPCPFYVPRTDAVQIKNVPQAPIGTASNCMLLSRTAVGVFQSYAEGTVVPLYVNGALRTTHSAWFPGRTEHVFESLPHDRRPVCNTCEVQFNSAPDGLVYCGPEELPELAIEESGFGHYDSQHEVFVSINYLPEFNKRFRKMIGLQPVYRASHEYVESAKRILSALPPRDES